MTIVDETEPCPDCIPGHDSIQCQTCFGECRVSRAAASSHPSEVVERVAKAIERAYPNFLPGFCRHIARAALSAIPQPAEVVGPAWRDKPNAVAAAEEQVIAAAESFRVFLDGHPKPGEYAVRQGRLLRAVDALRAARDKAGA
jgi:hypothetical protein